MTSHYRTERGTVLTDARHRPTSEPERRYDAGHLPDARSVPIDQLDDTVDVLTGSCRRGRVPAEVGEQAVKGLARPIEVTVREPRSPVGFELGDPDTCRIQQRPPSACGVDELRAPVGGIRSTLEVVQIAELVDELGARREAQRGLSRQVGQPDPLDSDVAPDLVVREAKVTELRFVDTGGQRLTELVEQAYQELTYSQAVGGQLGA